MTQQQTPEKRPFQGWERGRAHSHTQQPQAGQSPRRSPTRGSKTVKVRYANCSEKLNEVQLIPYFHLTSLKDLR